MGLPAVRPFAAAYPSEACWHWLCVSGMLSLPHGVCWAVQKQLSKEKGVGGGGDTGSGGGDDGGGGDTGGGPDGEEGDDGSGGDTGGGWEGGDGSAGGDGGDGGDGGGLQQILKNSPVPSHSAHDASLWTLYSGHDSSFSVSCAAQPFVGMDRPTPQLFTTVGSQHPDVVTTSIGLPAVRPFAAAYPSEAA